MRYPWIVLAFALYGAMQFVADVVAFLRWLL